MTNDSGGKDRVRVLVCGSRTYTNEQSVHEVLCAIHATNPISVVIDGAASGADTLAWGWGVNTPNVESERYPADWELHGKAAGPIRNQQMLSEGKPDLVVAFVDKPLTQSRGTFDMVKRSRAAGVRVVVVGVDDSGFIKAASHD
jgi:hypothetical protein